MPLHPQSPQGALTSDIVYIIILTLTQQPVSDSSKPSFSTMKGLSSKPESVISLHESVAPAPPLSSLSTNRQPATEG